MIKFFRTIRQELVMQNKSTKYLKYALGEIILVVIGILIALQINNWNESRKAKVKEVEILKDFQEGLRFDIVQLDSVILQYERAQGAITKVLNHLENNLPYSDSLDYFFFDTALLFETGGLTDGVYETLKSGGFDLITNKMIRDQIILVYDEVDPWLYNWEQRYVDLIDNAKRNVYNTRFMDAWGGDYKDPNIVGKMKPLNYEQLKQDDEFKYFLRTQYNDIGWLVFKPAKNTQIECKKLLRLVEKELSSVN